MKSIYKIVMILAAVVVGLAACQKAADLPMYGSGTAPVLTASATTVAPVPADSMKTALTLNWSNPKHATDSGSYKFVIEIDSAGKNFSNPATKTVSGVSSASFTAKELNTILLNRGYAFNVPVDMDVRVISSYPNNNERLFSNVLRIKMTPYKIPPKVQLPSTGRLFIVGSATVGGWNNPVPVPSQEFTRVDETTFAGIFLLTGGQEYLLLPVNGDWGQKYALPNNGAAGVRTGGDFAYYTSGGDNFLSPTSTGYYKIVVDFQTGKYTVTPFVQQHDLPTNLFLVGGATPGGWNNPVPVPSQQFTRRTSTVWDITIPLTSGQAYLILPENGNWGKKFGQSSASSNTKLAGTFAPEGGDFPSPDVSGNYKITVDFLNNSYKLVKL